MKKIILIFTVVLSKYSCLFGQTTNSEIINYSGRTVRVYDIQYHKDSTKHCDYHLLCRKFTDRPCKGTSQPNAYLNNIRLDIIAVDDSTNDTVFVKSFSREEINVEPFIINIRNSIDKLPPDLITLPLLQIKATDFRKNFKIFDAIDVKLKTRQKVQGRLKSFDKETITLQDFEEKIIVIQRKELVGIKACRPIWAIGSRVNFSHRCKYTNLENVMFKTVRQVPVSKPDKTLTFEWKE